ncbi:MAG: ATPase [Halomonas sp.]|nr:ATPase [Halomonas sp.]|tara:strand:- start:70 stop:1848 length:1779 start_codon:yes stop_codon:yes gene_type:complete
MTMQDYVISIEDDCYIGRVASVDTNRALILAESPEVIQTLTVSDLVAIQGATPQEFLVGIIEKVKRSVGSPILVEPESEDGEDEDFDAVIDHDVVQVALIGTYWEVLGDRRQIFKRGAKYFPRVDKQVYLIKEESLESLMSVVASDTPEDIQLVLGTYGNTQSKAVANGDKLFQRHAALLGSTGSGKSWTVASLLEQAAKLEHTNIILFDLHGEYKTLTTEGVEEGKQPIAEYYKIAGPADIENQNANSLFVPHWLLNKDEMLALLLDRSDNNAPNQASRFTHHVRELKQKYLVDENLTELASGITIDSPIPYSIRHLLALLSADDNGTKLGANGKSEVKGDWNGKLTRFIGRLETKIDDKRNSFLFDSPDGSNEYDWLAAYANQFLETKSDSLGIKVIDFSEVPSDILPIVIGVLTRFLYNVQFWRAEEERTPITFVCDEAHIYLPTKDASDADSRIALDTFEKVAKEGRKYGVSLLVVSQRPSDVSRTILSQCNNLIALRLSNPQDQQVVHKMMPDSLSSLTSVLPILDTGEAVVLGDAVLLPSRIKLNKPNLEPASATKDFWSDWSSRESKSDSIVFAVESLRRQSRQR